MSRKILLIEDDQTTADFIVGGLTEHGHVVDQTSDGRDGLFQATDGGYDAIILDRMLPGMDGLQVLRAIRAADISTPVIFLSAMASVEDRVTGIKSGSDDYLIKPFAFSELLARLERIMARDFRPAEAQTELGCDDLKINLLKRQAWRGKRNIDLQPREYLLLEYLMRHAGQVVTRTMLLEGVWNYHFDPLTNVIDVHISRLRRKIDHDGEKPLIHTVRGAGYRLGE
ncbi:MAG: winged helix-turn-helix domain-containing protein [Sphingobium sp.]